MNHGVSVYVIPESSTLLQMQGGIKPSYSTATEFQKMVTKLQAGLESSYYEYALNTLQIFNNNPIAILIDRGLMDGNAYMTDKKDFNKVLKYAMNDDDSNTMINTDELINNKYDMILHLVTAANGAQAFYTKEEYRNESIETAIILDDKIKDIYKNHKDRRIINNKSTFDDKMQLVISHISDKLNIENLSRKTLRFVVNIKDNNTDINHIINELQSCAPTHPLIVTYVIKYFLRDDDDDNNDNNNNDNNNESKKNGYTFIRETNVLHINSEKSIDEQIARIQKNSFDDFKTNSFPSWDDNKTIDIPLKAGIAWQDSTHYMLIKNNEECGQLINESEKLTKIRYNELRKYNRDKSKHRVEKIKIFFHYSQQFYALDIFLKPESHKNSMWLKVYRTPGNKYMPIETNTELNNVDVPSCIKVVKNVTSDPDFSSYSYSAD